MLHFITAHECLVRVGLHYSNLFNLSGLQELALLTGVIARSINLDSSLSDSPELVSHMSRIQRQMVALMSHFGQNDCIIKKMANGNLFPEEHKGKATKLVLEINTNCMTYAASIMGKGKNCKVLFIPSLGEAMPDYANAVHHGGRSMSLGQLVLMLQHTTAYLLTIRSTLRDLKEKLNSIHQLSSVELSNFLTEKNSRLSVMDQHTAVAEKIREKIQEKEHEWSLTSESVENAIFVIWRHLDYYFHSSTRQRIGKCNFKNLKKKYRWKSNMTLQLSYFIMNSL